MKKVWDRVGIAFSSVCVVHCVVVAFIPLFFPAFRVFTHESWVHIFVGFIILFTSPMAFIPGYRKHGLTWILGVAVLGLLFVLSGVLLEDHVSDQISHGISIMGSLVLVFAHTKNILHSQKHHHQCC